LGPFDLSSEQLVLCMDKDKPFNLKKVKLINKKIVELKVKKIIMH
jgi:hypothetical protein